jgi:hypothetical protein
MASQLVGWCLTYSHFLSWENLPRSYWPLHSLIPQSCALDYRHSFDFILHSLFNMFFLRSFLSIVLASALVSSHPGPQLTSDLLRRDDNGPTNGQLCGIQNNNAVCDEGWCCGALVRFMPSNWYDPSNFCRVSAVKVDIIVQALIVNFSMVQPAMQTTFLLLDRILPTHLARYWDQSHTAVSSLNAMRMVYSQ